MAGGGVTRSQAEVDPGLPRLLPRLFKITQQYIHVRNQIFYCWQEGGVFAYVLVKRGGGGVNEFSEWIKDREDSEWVKQIRTNETEGLWTCKIIQINFYNWFNFTLLQVSAWQLS